MKAQIFKMKSFLQGRQRYRILCLWERFVLLFEVELGQFSSHSISLKRLDVRLIEHFHTYRKLSSILKVWLRKAKKSLSQAKCPISLTLLYFSISISVKNLVWQFPSIFRLVWKFINFMPKSFSSLELDLYFWCRLIISHFEIKQINSLVQNK